MARTLNILVTVAALAYYYYFRQPHGNARVRKPQELNSTYDYIIGRGHEGSIEDVPSIRGLFSFSWRWHCRLRPRWTALRRSIAQRPGSRSWR